MILKVKSLHKHFGGIKAIDGCSIEIEKNKITAIIGPNGSGKSTLFNVIHKLYKGNSGSVHFKKQNITKLPDYKIARLGLARTFQEVRLFKHLTIADHLAISLCKDDESFINSLTGKEEETKKRAKEILDLVGLDKRLSTLATDLSYGQRKLLDLAVALAKPHELLMLDEPVAGVNPKLRNKIKSILKNLNKKGETIVVIEHDMTFVMDLADHIIVLDEGKVLKEGKPKIIQKSKKVLEAYLGD